MLPLMTNIREKLISLQLKISRLEKFLIEQKIFQFRKNGFGLKATVKYELKKMEYVKTEKLSCKQKNETYCKSFTINFKEL